MSTPTDTPEHPNPTDADGVQAAAAAALAAIAAATDLDELKVTRLAYAGDRSPLSLANRAIADLPKADKAAAGRGIGQARAQVNRAVAEREAVLVAERDARVLAEETVDVTLPYDRRPAGARHPDLHGDGPDRGRLRGDGLGGCAGSRARGGMVQLRRPELPEGPPGAGHAGLVLRRDPQNGQPQDTGLVLRTHTSPVQVRTMLDREPPIYVVCPGRVYRTDELDATHTPVFHQVEGLAIDRHLSMAHLKGTLDHFARAMFGPQSRTRLRPSFFPFTEPSAEMDVFFPDKKGGAGWVEWGGCGMVDPNVLRACGLDPAQWSGFAFGMGIERTLQFRNQIPDMRDLVEGDVRFTAAFGSEI